MLGFKSGVCVGGGGPQVLNRCKKTLCPFALCIIRKRVMANCN